MSIEFPLQFKNVSYKVGSLSLLNALNLTVHQQGITAIMGYNGAGKSLLLRLMHGLILPSSGGLLWNGKPTSAQCLQQQAMVFQKPVLLRRSAADNIQFVLKNRGNKDPQRCSALLHYVGLEQAAKTPARLLSGGEQQRLVIARALACQPKLLFLDEATASLDPASIALIERIVNDVAEQGTKIIFVTHDVGQAKRLANDVLFIHSGHVAEHTPASEFFSNPTSLVARAYLDGRLPT